VDDDLAQLARRFAKTIRGGPRHADAPPGPNDRFGRWAARELANRRWHPDSTPSARLAARALARQRRVQVRACAMCGEPSPMFAWGEYCSWTCRRRAWRHRLAEQGLPRPDREW
jgi:hypothetical protein